MVSATEGRELGGSGLAGWPTPVERDVGGDVVQVAGAGVAAAPGEHAVPVAEDHGLPDRFGWVVLVDGRLPGLIVVEVQDRDDGGAGGAEPPADLGGGG